MTFDGGNPGKGAARPSVPRCPICGKATVHASRPFCSRNCANIDLLRWLGGGYVLPSHDEEITGEDDHDGAGEA